jgi:hypothetical protein
MLKKKLKSETFFEKVYNSIFSKKSNVMLLYITALRERNVSMRGREREREYA